MAWESTPYRQPHNFTSPSTPLAACAAVLQLDEPSLEDRATVAAKHLAIIYDSKGALPIEEQSDVRLTQISSQSLITLRTGASVKATATARSQRGRPVLQSASLPTVDQTSLKSRYLVIAQLCWLDTEPIRQRILILQHQTGYEHSLSGTH